MLKTPSQTPKYLPYKKKKPTKFMNNKECSSVALTSGLIQPARFTEHSGFPVLCASQREMSFWQRGKKGKGERTLRVTPY